MDATTLITAAKIAADCSTYRDKAITLSIVVGGILVVGTWPGWRHEEIVGWEMLESRPAVLEQAIRSIDRQLWEHWRDEGQPSMKRRDDA